MSRATVAVRIAGHEYKIRTDSDADQVRQIAGYVDQAMGRIRERTGTVDSLDVAVLTCLNLAREILALREERLPAGATVVEEAKLHALIDRVESLVGLAEDTTARDGSAPASEAKGAESGEATGAPDPAEASEGASRTLELPSIESLRERSAEGAGEGDPAAAGATLEAPRVAAGGRDRAS